MVWWMYRLLLPGFLVLALPAWLRTMARRGGFGSGLRERLGIYRSTPEFEPCGAIHVHAVSVGEALLALRLIAAWQGRRPAARFVLAVATASGHAVARAQASADLRVVYQPIDLRCCVKRYLARFEPRRVVLVEGEMWPHLMQACARRGIAVDLVNARMSPRSRARYRRWAGWVRPVFQSLRRVAVMDESETGLWADLGVERDGIRAVGGMKFDPGEAPQPTRREAFDRWLRDGAAGRPVVLAASTHPGEEIVIARAVIAAGGYPVLVPRHAERREAVREALGLARIPSVLKSAGVVPTHGQALIIDTTGELRDWTAHADVVVVGKSLAATGGQNPAEAVLAGKPILFGPHMENFEPLASQLVAAGGAWRVADEAELTRRLRQILAGGGGPDPAAATAVLARHQGATQRTLDWLEA